MGYEISELAKADIIRLYAVGVVNFGVLQAEAYSLGLFESFEKIAKNPTLYRERSELSPAVRVCSYGSHVIIYTIKHNQISIIRVRHSREDWR